MTKDNSPHNSPSQLDQPQGPDTWPSLPRSQPQGCLPGPQHTRVSPKTMVKELDDAANYADLQPVVLPLGFHSHPSAGLVTAQTQEGRPPLNMVRCK